jgi:hypothetical protein
MRKLLLLFLFLGGAVFAGAREQWVTGHVFIRGTMQAMPFASVWLLDPQTGEPEYAAFTSVDGWYDFGNVEMDRAYLLKVTAPGCETVTKKIKPRYDANVQPNITYNIALERTPDAGMLMPAAMYVPAEIAPDAVTIEDVYGHIPGVIYEDGFFTDANGANVRILFNGYVMYSSSYEELCELVTAKDIVSIDYYDLSDTDLPYYAGVLDFRVNIVISNGPENTELPIESTFWNI